MEWTFKEEYKFHAYVKDEGEARFSFRASYFEEHRHYFAHTGYFFKDFIPDYPKNKKDPHISSVLGEHTYRSLILDSRYLYATPQTFIRQGDVFQNSAGFPLLQEVSIQPSCWIVLSQTCVVDNERYCSIVPGYLDEELTDGVLKELGLSVPNPRNGIQQNKKARLMCLPPQYIESPVVFDLAQVYTIQSSVLKRLVPAFSLTFPGNAYFCNRMAYFNFRDVQNADEKRMMV